MADPITRAMADGVRAYAHGNPVTARDPHPTQAAYVLMHAALASNASEHARTQLIAEALYRLRSGEQIPLPENSLSIANAACLRQPRSAQ